MPSNMIFYFRFIYFHVSNCALFSTSYFSTLIYMDVVLTLPILMILLCYFWCYGWFEMRYHYDVPVPLSMIYDWLKCAVGFHIHPVLCKVGSVFSCVDIETMPIYIDIPAVASLRRTILCWFIVTICWHFPFSIFVLFCFSIENVSTGPGGGYSLYIISSNHQWISRL